MNSNKQKYYIGLDCGTSSVGWAVTDEKYNLLTANGKSKKNGKVKTKKYTLHGVRLFDEADTAAERRVYRSARRRNRRAKDRLRLLRMLFHDEMLKVDPEFYKRLRESFYYEADKRLKNKSKNTLFNDIDFTDEDYYKKYPTIWHLRQAIVESSEDEHFDLRLYFLAIQHILKHRGHFLFEGKLSDSGNDFEEIFEDFCETAANYGFAIEPTMSKSVEAIIIIKDTITNKKKALKDLALFLERDEEADDAKKILQAQNALCDLLVGSSINLAVIFPDLATDEKLSYSLSQLDEKEDEIASNITVDNMPLLTAAKRIYDYGILRNLLGNHELLCDAMVANYDQHKKDLKKLKDIFKPHPELYQKLFKAEVYDKPNSGIGFPSYTAYIGSASTSKNKASAPVNQEDFNKHLKKCLEEINYDGELLNRAEKGELLPKQHGQSKGTIPQQLHHKELEKILEKLGQDYPSFTTEAPGEHESYNTKLKKIALLHSFRIPYYCGPLAKRLYDDDKKVVIGGKSQFSWADEEISELVRPWNFDQLVNKDQRAESFIRRMTNECTYLLGKDVLPKNSFMYQKYMVLNELNDLRVNGQPLDVKIKQEIFEQAFQNNELSGNITLNKLSRWLKEHNLIESNDEVSGTSEAKFLPKLKTYLDFQTILGANFQKKFSSSQLEVVVEAITILGDEKAMLCRKIANILGLAENSREVIKLARLSYKDWGRLSAEFLNGIMVDNHTILDWLWESQHNLQQLLGQEVGFSQAIEVYNTNSGRKPKAGTKIKYSDVQSLYCSPAVKRSIWQTIRIVDEVVKAKKTAPAKIFLEVTRSDDKKAKGSYTLKRKQQLEDLYKKMQNDPEVKRLLSELSGKDDRALQSKKLFLYFTQMGRCAYSGESINLDEINNINLYDIDHIYPRSLTKDDSITRNLVLVKAKYNRDKTNQFLCEFPDWQNKMQKIWRYWLVNNLITSEKYNRLTRRNPLSSDELGDFIARQLVETSQSVKSIRDLLKTAYPQTEVVMVKAEQVSEFRHLMSYDKKDSDGNVTKVGQPEFIKIRELNDYHHAKDAYLNIVVGNVMNETFTSDPRHWVKNRGDTKYTIIPSLIFRKEWEYRRKTDNKITHFPDVQGWNYAESLQIISNNMKRNDILWTRMSYIESSEIADLQPVRKTTKLDGILPLKHNSRLARKDDKNIENSGVAKYGGYNSIKGAHFALIECENKKGESERYIISIPQLYKNNINKYLQSSDKYKNARVILPVIRFKSVIKINGVPLHITYRTNNQIGFQHMMQLEIPLQYARSIKNVSNVVKKMATLKGYKIQEEKDSINDAVLDELFDFLADKAMVIHKNTPTLNVSIKRLASSKENFVKLATEDKCPAIIEILKVLSCSAEKGDWSKFANVKNIGSILHSSNITGKNIVLMNQSPAGLYEECINLQTIQPRPSKSYRKS